MSKTAIILDTEFTTWVGAMAAGWVEDWQHREIVQISAVKINTETLEILEKFDQLTKPRINPELSDFFTELTGITQAEVDRDGLSFIAGYDGFKAFVDGDTVHCYGWDGRVIAENLEMNDAADRIPEITFSNLQPYFGSKGVDASVINSGKLASHFGVDIEIREHNAMDDVYSIHAALKHLKAQGHNLPFKYKEAA